MIHKRWPLFLFLLFFACTASAVPITRIYGTKPHPKFIKGHVERLLAWQEQQGVSWTSHWNSQEKALFNVWKDSINEWGYPLENDQLYEHLLWSFPVRNGALEKPSLFLGLSTWPEQALPLLAAVAKSRGYLIPEKALRSVHGFQWSLQDNSFEIHFLVPTGTAAPLPLPQQLATEEQQMTGPKWLKAAKHIITLSAQQQVISTKLTGTLAAVNWKDVGRPLPFDILSLQKTIDAKKSIQWRMDLRSLSPMALNPVSQPWIDGFAQQFLLYPDSLSFTDRNNYTLYYP